MPQHANIIEALIAVGRDVGFIEKRLENVRSQYQARGIDDVLSAFHGPLMEHGVVVFPNYDLLNSEYIKVPMSDGTERVAHSSTVKGTFTFAMVPEGADQPQQTVISAVGFATDYSDKSVNQAMQAAMKYAFLQAFVVPTGAEDADAKSPELGTVSQSPSKPRSTASGPSLADKVSRVAGSSTDTSQSTVRMVTEPQGRNLYRLWHHKLDWDKERYMDEIELVLDVRLTDDRQLTAAQANTLITALKERAGEGDAPPSEPLPEDEPPF